MVNDNPGRDSELPGPTRKLTSCFNALDRRPVSSEGFKLWLHANRFVFHAPDRARWGRTKTVQPPRMLISRVFCG